MLPEPAMPQLIDPDKLDKLAEVAIKVGLGLQPGQDLYMTSPMSALPLARKTHSVCCSENDCSMTGVCLTVTRTAVHHAMIQEPMAQVPMPTTPSKASPKPRRDRPSRRPPASFISLCPNAPKSPGGAAR